MVNALRNILVLLKYLLKYTKIIKNIDWKYIYVIIFSNI